MLSLVVSSSHGRLCIVFSLFFDFDQRFFNMASRLALKKKIIFPYLINETLVLLPTITMAKAEIGTAKYQSKKLKASGLQKLKYYCQLCQKQCRDANGFKNHLNSPSHTGRISNLESSGEARSLVDEYSTQFKSDFMRLLKINHGTKKVNANKFYQEYILNDKHHVHMNSTRWGSLTAFIKYLGQNGLVKVENAGGVDDDEFNLEIRLVDSSGDGNKSNNDREKELKSEEDLSMKLLNQQIKQGQAADATSTTATSNTPSKEIKLSTGPVKLSLKKTTKKPIKKIRSAFDSDNDDD